MSMWVYVLGIEIFWFLFGYICYFKSNFKKKEEGKLEVEVYLIFVVMGNLFDCILWYLRGLRLCK